AIADEIAAAHALEHVPFFARSMGPRCHRAVPVDLRIPGVDKADAIAASPQCGQLLLDLAWMPEIVGVDRRNELAFRFGDPAVAGGGDAGVVLPDQTHPVVRSGEAAGDLGRTVARTVIDNQDLEIVV